RHRLPLRERLVANLPRYAPTAARLSGLLNLRNRSRLLAQAGEKLLGFSAQRPLPQWSSKPFREPGASVGKGESGEVVLLVDTFNRYFEPHIVDAAVSVLQRTGFKVHFPTADTTSRPLCCGRTFLSAGLVEKAREEARRSANALRPYVERGMKIVGLEPSCLFGLRDEWQNLIPNTNDIAQQSQLIDEFLAENLDTTLDGLTWRNDDQRVLVHGHCHQKAFDTFPRTLDLINKVPGMQAEPIQSSCCGMAGAFGYQAENFDVSQKMGEADLLPAVRKAGADTVIVANGTSCRQQIRDGAQRSAQHVIELIDQQIL
ncbi:MAG TPA: heterodisulfide reductase-related iron-sulfur binding cluster, partial [Paracoccaceae bacterium]|nr:heterodisulfide reductase-related iron-sulfur binding cluster [Paracoccaceae bacterium]